MRTHLSLTQHRGHVADKGGERGGVFADLLNESGESGFLNCGQRRAVEDVLEPLLIVLSNGLGEDGRKSEERCYHSQWGFGRL